MKEGFLSEEARVIEQSLKNMRTHENWEQILEKVEHANKLNVHLSKKFYDMQLLAAGKLGRGDLCYKLLEDILSSGQAPTIGTLLVALSSMRQSNIFSNKSEIDNLYHKLEASPLILMGGMKEIPISFYGSFARIYLKGGYVEEGEKLWEKMKQMDSNNLMDNRNWFVLMELEDKKERDFHKTLEMLKKLNSECDEQVTKDMAVLLAQMLNDELRMEDMSSLVSFVRKEGIEMKPVFFSQVIEFQASHGRVEDLCETLLLLFERAGPTDSDTGVLANLLDFLGKKNKVREAKLVYEETLRLYRSPEKSLKTNIGKNDFFFSMMLKAMGANKEHAYMEKVLEDIKSLGVEMGTRCFNILIFAHGMVDRNFEKVDRLVSEMKKKGIPFDAATYTTLANIGKNRKSFDSAISMGNKMRDSNQKISSKSLSPLVSAHAEKGEIELALKYFNSILEIKEVPYSRAFRDIILHYLTHDSFKQGYKYYRLMQESFSLEPPLAVSHAILTHCPHSKVEFFAHKFLSSGVLKPSVTFYNILINRYGEMGDFEKCISLFQQIKREFSPDAVTYKSIISKAVKCNRLEHVEGIYKEMCSKYSPPGDQYSSCFWMDYLFKNQQRISEIEKNYKTSLQGLLRKNSLYLCVLFVSAGRSEDAFSVIEALKEKKVFLDYTFFSQMARNIGLLKSEKHLQRLLPMMPAEMYPNQRALVNCSLSTAFLRCRNLNEALKFSEKFLDKADSIDKKQLTEFFEEILSHYCSKDHESKVKHWLDRAVKSKSLSVKLVNQVLSYFSSRNMQDMIVKVFEICKDSHFCLDDTSFSFLFSSIKPSNLNSLIPACELLAKHGTLLFEESDLSNPLVNSLKPHIRDNYDKMRDAVSSQTRDSPIFAQDVLLLFGKIHSIFNS